MKSVKCCRICMSLVFAICLFLSMQSANAGVFLTVNGLSGGLRQFDPNTPLYLGISDTSSTNTYDLTITATGGSFGDITDPNSPMIVNDNIVSIACSDVNDISTVEFNLSGQMGLAMVHLITNEQIEIDEQTVDRNSTIYQLIIVKNSYSGSVSVFSMDYAALTYQQPSEQGNIPIEPQDIEPEHPTPATFLFENPDENPDLSGDEVVNYIDLSLFSANWGQTGIGLDGDFNGNAVVDANDLMHIAYHWLCYAQTGDFSAENLPYLTDFRNFTPNESINNQHYWLVESGNATVISEEPNDVILKYVLLGSNSQISKAFNDCGKDNSVIRFDVLPESGAKVEISKDSTTFIGVRFGTSKIEVLDNGSYTASAQDNPVNLSKMKVQIDYNQSTYDVYYNDTEIYSNASFIDPNGFDKVSFFSATSLIIDRFSITDEIIAGGVVGNDGSIYISSPCACPDDDLNGKIVITGKIWWEDMSYYEILYWPVNEELPAYLNDWHLACEGYNTVPDGGTIGYWDTDILPDDYYYLAIVVYDIQGKQVKYGVVSTDIYYNNVRLESMSKAYSISSELKTNTFQQMEEKADTEVDWAGEYPFELRRSYNNSRRFYSKPLYNGHSFTYSNIRLTEYVTDDNCARGLYNWPRHDGAMLSSGEIFVVYPDGSSGTFECNQSSSGQYTTIYEAMTETKQGDIVKRKTFSDDDPDWVGIFIYAVEGISYELITKNGEHIFFSSSQMADQIYNANIIGVPENITGGGRTGWTASARPDGLTDKYGNRLNLVWDNDNDLKELSTSDLPGRKIVLTKTNGYYTKAELLLDDNAIRTVEYTHDAQSGTFNVTREGYINQQAVNYTKTYYNDENFNLRTISSLNDFDSPDIWVDYDRLGRVVDRWDFVDYVQSGYTYLQTHYEYGVNLHDKIYTTVTKTPYLSSITRSNEKGGMLSQVIVTNDGSSSKNSYAQYSNTNHPTLPTQTTEVFDGKERITENQYDGNGNLTEQRVCIDGQRYALTEMDYQNSYNLPIRQTQWQDYLKDGSGGEPEKKGRRVETINTYSDDPNGLSTQEGPYLVEQKRLVDSYIDEQTQQEVDVWAVAKFTYHANGRLKSKQVYQDYGLATQSIIEEEFTSLDSNRYPAFVWQGLIPTANDPNLPLTVSGYDETPQSRYLYNSIGERILEANYLGEVKRYVYETFGRVASVETSNDSAAMTRSDFTDSTYAAMNPIISVEYSYDSRDNVVEEYHSTGKTISTYYNIANKPWLTLSTENTETQHEREEYIQYNSRGLEVYRSTFYWNGSGDIDDYPDNFSENIVLSYYDYMGRLKDKYWFDTNTEIATAEGYINESNVIKHTSSVYGGNDKPSLQKNYGYGNSIEKTTAIEYDIFDGQSKVTVSPGGLGIITEYHYDAVGNHLYTIDPAGNVLISDYDNANRKIADYFTAEKQYIEVLANPDDPNDTSTVSVFDFDETRGDAKLKRELFYYDNDKLKGSLSYDNDGTNTLAYKEFQYDKRGRLTAVTEDIDSSTNAVTAYTYSDIGDLGPTGDLNYHIKVTDGQNKNTYTKLNLAGRPLKILHSSGDYEEYQYANDNLLYKEAVWNSVGTKQWLEYGYDGFGREVLKTYPDSGYVATGYDGLDRQITVSDGRNSSDNIGGTGQVSYEYDCLGRLASYTDHDGYEIAYLYRGDGQTMVVKIYDNQTTPQLIYYTRYSYDSAGRLIAVYDGNPLDYTTSYLAALGYDINGNRSNLSYYIEGSGLGDTVDINYDYDVQNRLIGYAATGVTFSLDADANGDIDGLGRLTSATEVIGANTYALDYDYNNRSELTDWQINTTTGSYSYDLAGNITSDGINSYSYTGDLLTAIGANAIDWDYNGALTSNLSASIVRNLDGQIQSAVVGTDSITCKYTSYGDMIQKTVSDGTSTTEKYILDITGDYPVILVVIDTSDSSVKNKYFYADKDLLAQETGGEKYFYLKDRLGSVRAMIDNTGSIVNNYVYTPYGESLAENETVDNSFKFASYNFDETTELYYLNARWYDPAIQRFASCDPFEGEYEEPLTLHAYLYCLNDPVNATDPTGEFVVAMKLREEEAKIKFGILVAVTYAITQANDLHNLALFFSTSATEAFNDIGYAIAAGNQAIIDIFTRERASDLISGRGKRSASYHGELAGWTVEELERAERQRDDPELARRARQMLKLIKEGRGRLDEKTRTKPGGRGGKR